MKTTPTEEINVESGRNTVRPSKSLEQSNIKGSETASTQPALNKERKSWNMNIKTTEYIQVQEKNFVGLHESRKIATTDSISYS